MGKYFRKLQSGIKLSEYIDTKGLIDVYKIKTIKHLIKVLGDISLPEDILEVYIKFYEGGIESELDVTYEDETAIGLYEFYKTFPYLTPEAFEKVAATYIKDVYDYLELIPYFKEVVRIYGKTDMGFLYYMDHIRCEGGYYQLRFDKAAREFSLAKYSKKLERYLQDAIEKKHLSSKKVVEALPSVKMVSIDIKQFEEISKKYELERFSTTQEIVPLTYRMIEDSAREKDLLELYGEVPMYKLFSGKLIRATFTTQEFIDESKHKCKKKGDNYAK